MNRSEASGALTASHAAAGTYGEYFEAARSFLERDDYRVLRTALSEIHSAPVPLETISRVHIRLLKHGEFYHPARVEVTAGSSDVHFVLNVAVSSEGRRTIGNEFSCLRKLQSDYPVSFIPVSYDLVDGHSSPEPSFPMFLGQWFDGFHEFHLADSSGADPGSVIVWKENTGTEYLSQEQTAAVIRQAAMILTYYYNPFTTERIHPWHHAAGDFIVNIDNDVPDVRMITVRDYSPMLSGAKEKFAEAPQAQAIADALVLYFVSISIKLRIDRLDGTGDIALYPAQYLHAFCEGFGQGLGLMAMVQELEPSFADDFMIYLSSHSCDQLYELAVDCMNTMPEHSRERQATDKELKMHVNDLHRCLSQNGRLAG